MAETSRKLYALNADFKLFFLKGDRVISPALWIVFRSYRGRNDAVTRFFCHQHWTRFIFHINRKALHGEKFTYFISWNIRHQSDRKVFWTLRAIVSNALSGFAGKSPLWILIYYEFWPLLKLPEKKVCQNSEYAFPLSATRSRRISLVDFLIRSKMYGQEKDFCFANNFSKKKKDRENGEIPFELCVFKCFFLLDRLLQIKCRPDAKKESKTFFPLPYSLPRKWPLRVATVLLDELKEVKLTLGCNKELLLCGNPV